MSRHAEAVIDLAHFRHNYQVAKTYAGSARVLAVIKANGYGHGAIQLAKALPAADAFGVACLDEALELRAAGVTQPILLMAGFFDVAELPAILAHQLDLVIHSCEQVDALLAFRPSAPSANALKLWLKLDSGMRRLGLAPEAFRCAWRRLRACSLVGEVRLMSHLASADVPGDPFVAEQISSFDAATAGIDGLVSLANSAALVALPQARRAWVRPGIMLYGASPFAVPHAIAAELRPVMTLRAKLIATREISAGESVGYGQTWRAGQPSRVGTIAIGYGDGYPRHARSGTPVLVNGRRATLVGRVSMDMLTVDLTAVAAARTGDTAILWGAGLPATEVAAWADTISYELFTGVNRRVEFLYTAGG